MKKKAIICSFCLFFLVNTMHAQGKIERIKTFEGKEKQAEQDILDAENKLISEKPGHAANKILWENKAEDIRINHGLKQHEEQSAEFIYWKGEFNKANEQAAFYQGEVDMLQGVYDAKKMKKNRSYLKKMRLSNRTSIV